jgi:hypothetical protein
LFTGIKHEDILSELEKDINLEDIKSIQMTEKSCIETLKSEQAKYKILNSEISLKNRSANYFEIDKNVNNVRPVFICIQSDFESPKIGSNWKNWCTI